MMTGLISEQEHRLERRSQALWDHLVRTERRAEELARETERLRRIKDEAKRLVAEKHPHLFRGEGEHHDEFESLSEGSMVPPDANAGFLSRDLREIRCGLRLFFSEKCTPIIYFLIFSESC